MWNGSLVWYHRAKTINDKLYYLGRFEGRSMDVKWMRIASTEFRTIGKAEGLTS
jgi:hypothetical protein